LGGHATWGCQHVGTGISHAWAMGNGQDRDGTFCMSGRSYGRTGTAGLLCVMWRRVGSGSPTVPVSVQRSQAKTGASPSGCDKGRDKLNFISEGIKVVVLQVRRKPLNEPIIVVEQCDCRKLLIVGYVRVKLTVNKLKCTIRCSDTWSKYLIHAWIRAGELSNDESSCRNEALVTVWLPAEAWSSWTS